MSKHLANILTFLNLAFGFLSLTYTISGKYNTAALMIILSVIMDSLDGRAARHFDSECDLGKNLDSLSDIVSFGVAPAILIYQYELYILPIFGLLIAIFYCLCGAYRLARFNASPQSNLFQGVPITFAGGLVAVSTFVTKSMSIWFWGLLLIILSFLMISKLKVPKISTKNF